MIDTPQQRMLGIFSVFVRWVSDVQQVKTGPCIRVRAAIGPQWATVQIPLAIAPSLKKGDFIEVIGSVTALPDKDGASPYLFVQEIRSHIPAEEIANGRQSSNASSRKQASCANRAHVASSSPNRAENNPPNAYAPRQPNQEQNANTLQRKGGYRANKRRAEKVDEAQAPVIPPRNVDVNVQAYARTTQQSNQPAGVSTHPSQGVTAPATATGHRPVRTPGRARRRIQSL